MRLLFANMDAAAEMDKRIFPDLDELSEPFDDVSIRPLPYRAIAKTACSLPSGSG